MENSNNTSGKEKWEIIPYSIKRESKILKFININEVEEESTYLIVLEKSKRSKDSNYKLELPLTYFRIPEKTIQEYQKYLEVKDFFKRNITIKKYIEEFEEFRINLNEYEKLLAKIKEKGDFSETIKFYEKLKKKTQEIEKSPNYQELVQKYGLTKRPIKNLNAILLKTKSKILFEKIIWHYIFERILNPSDSNFKNTKLFIEKEIKNKNRETKLKKIKIPEKAKKEINKIKIREHIEESDNFENIILYPYSKKKIYFHHNTSYKWLLIPYMMLYFFFLIFSVFIYRSLILEEMIIWIIIIIVILVGFPIIIKVLERVMNSHNKIMKTGNLKAKFEEKITGFLIKQTEKKKKPEDNIKRRLFLDSFSEILFTQIYKFVFRDLDKCIRDYKSFNPVSIEIFLDKDQVFPLATSYEGFFHKTSIPIYLSSLKNKEEFNLKIITRRSIRKNKKYSRMLNNRTFLSENLRTVRIIIHLILMVFLISVIILEILVIPILIISLLWLSLFNNPLFLIRTKYIYYSSLMAESNLDFTNDKLFIVNLFSRLKNIYPVTIDLREDCSYYFLAYAPRFHRIKFTKDMKEILKDLYAKLPTELSTDILSFNIPRKKKLKKKVEFDIDLEIPIAGRIWCWIIGIFLMLILMIISGIIYIISIINPLLFVDSLDLSTLRFVLTFLTMLIGFFGKDILSEPTKDLHKIGIILIVISIFVGMIFVTPIFISLI